MNGMNLQKWKEKKHEKLLLTTQYKFLINEVQYLAPSLYKEYS